MGTESKFNDLVSESELYFSATLKEKNQWLFDLERLTLSFEGIVLGEIFYAFREFITNKRRQKQLYTMQTTSMTIIIGAAPLHLRVCRSNHNSNAMIKRHSFLPQGSVYRGRYTVNQIKSTFWRVA